MHSACASPDQNCAVAPKLALSCVLDVSQDASQALNIVSGGFPVYACAWVPAGSTDPKGDSKAEDMPRLPASRQGGVPAAKSLAAPASLKAPVPIPTCPVEVQMHHMGLFSFKGIADKLELCQATPAQLAERMRSYLDVVANSNGKISCIRRVESVALSMTVMLPDILHLPLAAEPPLYINVTPAGAPHQATRGTRQTDLILAHQHKTQD